jgi:putative thioredoxin
MIYLTDENFEKEIQKADKPVLVDFYGLWCGPCQILSPILEKLEGEFKERIIFAKLDTDASPQTTQKFGITNLPTVLYFEKGRPIAGFIGARTEGEVKSWLEEILAGKEKREFDELLKEMEDYAKKHALKLNPNQKIVETIIKGLLANEKKYGWRYCPCRRVTGNFQEDWPKICPCKWHWDEIEKDGHCHCGLFVKP